MLRRRYFSIEEANALIPTLGRYCQRMILLLRDMLTLRDVLQAAGVRPLADGMDMPVYRQRELEPLQRRYEQACALYDQHLRDLADLGIEVVNAEAGIMHMYSWWDGEEVVLSWQYGEPTVQFWCDPGELFTERRSIRQIFFDVPEGRAVRH